MSYHGTTLVNPGFNEDDLENAFEGEEGHCCTNSNEGIIYSIDHQCKGFLQQRFTVATSKGERTYQGSNYNIIQVDILQSKRCVCVCDQASIYGGNHYEDSGLQEIKWTLEDGREVDRNTTETEFSITYPVQDCDCPCKDSEYAAQWERGDRGWSEVTGHIIFNITQNATTGELYKGDDPSTPPAVLDATGPGVRVRIPIQDEGDTPPITIPPFILGSNGGGSRGWGVLGTEDEALRKIQDCIIGTPNGITHTYPDDTDSHIRSITYEEVGRSCDRSMFDFLSSLFPEPKCTKFGGNGFYDIPL